jgi:hypothetical protein
MREKDGGKKNKINKRGAWGARKFYCCKETCALHCRPEHQRNFNSFKSCYGSIEARAQAKNLEISKKPSTALIGKINPEICS